MECAALAFPYGSREPLTYESNISQCWPSGCTSCLGKRAQRLECRGLEMSSIVWCVSNPTTYCRREAESQSIVSGSHGSCMPEDCISHTSWLATGWLDEQSFEFSVINWLPKSPKLNPIEHLWIVLERDVKGPHTTPTKHNTYEAY
ncbi:hypothetical protein TNCV_1557781 [Trichonephila clavipes]|uniref:Tc1-like transposase DDE domain-containing protein n=1 Tax=Trichonephila clavipes TaxID=2585209 RepID=A0A8X6R5E6_TRICX|nr:hypothetical protein TNCV_1557781 [Trichonephila clavipes]